MGISGRSVSIADGHTTPDAADDTDFGKASLPTGAVEHTFTITNSDLAALSVDSVILSGHSGDFQVTQTPASSVAAGGGTTTFKITFTPTATGTRSVEVSIANNDADENPYTFRVQGQGVSLPAVTTAAATGVTTSEATLGGTITSDGADTVSATGVVYSTTDSTPTSGEPGVTQETNSDLMGAFSESIGGLTPAARYYYQAYATNPQGTSYGGVVEFTTLNSIVSITRSGPALTNAASLSWTVTFEAPATGLTAANLALVNTGLTGAAITGMSDSGGNTWTVTASTGTGSGTLGLDLTSAAGLNAGLSNAPYNGPAYTIDRTPPTVTVEQAAGQTDPTTGSPINFTVVFSEPVTGFEAADVLTGGTAGAATVTLTGSGTTYNVAVHGMTRAGTVTVTIPAGAAQDAAANDSAASTSVDNTVTYTPFYYYLPVVSRH